MHRPPALLRRLREWRRSTGPSPWPRSRRRRWSGATILESRRGRMPRLPRAHWPLPRSIERPPLSGRRRLRQAVLLAQPFLNNLLHGLPLFMRQLNLGRCRRSHYRRRNSPGRQGRPRARCGLHHRGRHYRGRDHGRRGHLLRRRWPWLFLNLWLCLRFNPRFCLHFDSNRFLCRLNKHGLRRWRRRFYRRWRLNPDFLDKWRSSRRWLFDNEHTEFLAQGFGQAIFDRVGV